MAIKKMISVKFAPRGNDSFYEYVLHNAATYFKTKGISPFANTEMWIKTGVMLCLYFLPLVIIVSGIAEISIWLYYIMWVLMAAGMVGVGTSIMHDANHGAYSKNKRVNNFISHILGVIGGYTVTWRIQHNILHHTYTNISGLDEDIGTIKFLRLSPNQKWSWYHKYQHIYAWFFYMLNTLFWMTVKDYRQVVRYKQHNLLIKQKVSFSKALVVITAYKILYFSYIIILPLLFAQVAGYHVLFGFLLMHVIAGLALSCIFQPAHIVETSEYALPFDNAGKKEMENSWAIHEVANTTDFGPDQKFLSWFIGGLNFQIEHHLFSGICHVHYPKLAHYVKEACNKYNIPYNVQPTFGKAVHGHFLMLKQLGKQNNFS